jgi:hypothetical protein
MIFLCCRVASWQSGRGPIAILFGTDIQELKIGALLERGFHKPGYVENRFGYHVGKLIIPA